MKGWWLAAGVLWPSCGPTVVAAEEDGGACAEDSNSFVDAQGYGCSDWAPPMDCGAAHAQWGYSAGEESQIISACCVTCGQGALGGSGAGADGGATGDSECADQQASCASFLAGGMSCDFDLGALGLSGTIGSQCQLSCGTCAVHTAGGFECVDTESSCPMLLGVGYTCDYDIGGLLPSAPPGTQLSDLCALSCRVCNATCPAGAVETCDRAACVPTLCVLPRRTPGLCSFCVIPPPCQFLGPVSALASPSRSLTLSPERSPTPVSFSPVPCHCSGCP